MKHHQGKNSITDKQTNNQTNSGKGGDTNTDKYRTVIPGLGALAQLGGGTRDFGHFRLFNPP